MPTENINVINEAKLFTSGDLENVKKIEAYLLSVAKKIHPDRDWDTNPIEYRLSDDDSVNACIFTKEKTPVIAVTKGALAFVKNEDELAFLLGHEHGHDDIKSAVGDVETTKPEEGGADVLSVYSLIGPDNKTPRYNPRAGIKFFRRLQEKMDAEGVEKTLGEKLENVVFDVHLSTKNRIFAMDSAIFERSNKGGEIKSGVPKPLDEVVNLPHRDARHETQIESILPKDYLSWSPEKKLRYLTEKIKINYTDYTKSPTFDGGPDRIQLLNALEKIESDGSFDYFEAADDFATMAAKIDPYNMKFQFDPLYKKVAKTIQTVISQFSVALGPFRKLNEALKDFSTLDPKQDDKIAELAKVVSGELDNVLPYFKKGERIPDSLSPYRNNKQYAESYIEHYMKYYSEYYSGVVFTTEINQHIRKENIRSLYPLAKNPEAIKTIWKLGGGYDETFWMIIGPEQLKELREIESVGSGRHGNESPEQRAASFADMQLRTDRWLRKTRPTPSGAGAQIITDYVKQHYDELFPLKEMRDSFQNTMEARHPESRTFTNFVVAEFNKASPQKRKNLLGQLNDFYGDCSFWLENYSFNHGRKRSLTQEHPYIQLLANKELGLANSFIKKQVDRIANLDDIDYEMFKSIFNIQRRHTVKDCLADYFKFQKENDFSSPIARVTGTEINRIFRAKTHITLNDPDLSAISKVMPDNRDFDKIDGNYRYNCADQIVWSKEIVDAVSKKLEMGSTDEMALALKDSSLDDVVSIYRFLERNVIFPTTNKRLALGKVLLEKLNKTDLEKRMEVCEKMLLRAPEKDRISNPDTYVTANLSLRDGILKVWQAGLVEKFGHDDGSVRFHETVGEKIDSIFKYSTARDQGNILETLADGLVIQSSLAKKIRDGFNPKAEDLVKSNMPITGAEALMLQLETDEKLRLSVIDFLSEPQSMKSLSAMTQAIKSNESLTMDLAGIGSILRVDRDKKGNMILNEKNERKLENNLRDIHSHFSHLSFEQRTLALSALLVPPEHRLSDKQCTESYCKAIDLVMNKVFPKNVKYSGEAKSFIQAYLKTASEEARIPLLAGMLSVSIDQNPGQPSSIAQQTAKILAAMGPAYVKLGQAIHSHPDCPTDWREALNGLKSSAKTDPRWDLIKQLEGRLPESIKNEIVRYGAVLGSASFNIAIPLILKQEGKNKEVVALLERCAAANRAESGFEHLDEAVKDWQSPFVDKYRETMREMIGEGKEMAVQETSRKIGNGQYVRFKEVYAGRQITVGNGNDKTIININPVSSLFDAEGVRLLSLAEGTHFSDLPESTPQELALKKTIAKGYVALELTNMLTGPFDCDRHGSQGKVVVHPDGKTVDFNLFDPGGMGEAPTDKQKAAVGKAVNAIVEGMVFNKSPQYVIMDVIKNTNNLKDRKYLMRIRKASLALGDYTRYLDKWDYLDIVRSVVSSGIDPVVMKNIALMNNTDTAAHASLKDKAVVAALKLAKWLDLHRSGTKIVLGTHSDQSAFPAVALKKSVNETPKMAEEPRILIEDKTYSRPNSLLGGPGHRTPFI